MKVTTHEIIFGPSQKMEQIKSNSINLVVTSPPYPMIEMWDEIMSDQNSQIKEALNKNNGSLAYELMHLELDKVWEEVERVLTPGGFACINIGDATRTIGGEFALYPNHARIISAFQKLKLSNLPNIIWRKQTNAPNKFMGSGMLPAGAYVTLEHEWILIFRKGGKRQFKTKHEKLMRQESSFFWEERNSWFSDLWDLKGTKQKIENSPSRKRSAAYPFELPYRLINMYSLKGDTILDPFLGMGTTIMSAIASERNSIGYEIDSQFLNIIKERIENISINKLNDYIGQRIGNHVKFVSDRVANINKNEIKHYNKKLSFPVITKQEVNMNLSYIREIKINTANSIVAYHIDNNNDYIEITKKEKTEETINI